MPRDYFSVQPGRTVDLSTVICLIAYRRPILAYSRKLESALTIGQYELRITILGVDISAASIYQKYRNIDSISIYRIAGGNIEIFDISVSNF